MALETQGGIGETRTGGPPEPISAEYFDSDVEGSAVAIHMNMGAMDGITRDVIEGFKTLPRRGLEVGGLLLGRVETGSRPVVWIESYRRVPCQHRFGPQFVLDGEETAALEAAAESILKTGDLVVVGFYRSHTRPGFQLEDSDFELIRRYFSDPSDLILLIRPQTLSNIYGQFYCWAPGGGAQPAGGEFPFHGRVILSGALPETSVPAQATEPNAVERAATEKAGTEEPAAEAPVTARSHPRRLVPDFAPLPVEPAPSLYSLAGNSAADRSASDHWRPPEPLPEEHGMGDRLKKWLPLIAAAVLVGVVLWFFLQPGRRGLLSTAATAPSEPTRPLGLYVDPGGETWHVLWNPNATQDARGVQLFVREKDDQIRADLSARDLATGSYQYRPAGNDVTFRLEVTDRAGRVSAESFRLMQTAGLPGSAPATAASPAPKTEPPAGGAGRITQPRATYRAPPVVAAGIRPRIKGTIPIDVRVHIDAGGHVTSASPITKQNSGLEEYLATRAVQAARLWRFEPAREDGKPIPGTQTIHFVFTK